MTRASQSGTTICQRRAVRNHRLPVTWGLFVRNDDDRGCLQVERRGIRRNELRALDDETKAFVRSVLQDRRIAAAIAATGCRHAGGSHSNKPTAEVFPVICRRSALSVRRESWLVLVQGLPSLSSRRLQQKDNEQAATVYLPVIVNRHAAEIHRDLYGRLSDRESAEIPIWLQTGSTATSCSSRGSEIRSAIAVLFDARRCLVWQATCRLLEVLSSTIAHCCAASVNEGMLTTVLTAGQACGDAHTS